MRMTLNSAPESKQDVTALIVRRRSVLPAANAMNHGTNLSSPTNNVTLISFEAMRKVYDGREFGRGLRHPYFPHFNTLRLLYVRKLK